MGGNDVINPYTGEHYTAYYCPICGHECETIMLDRTGDPVGCEFCLTEVKSWTYDYD